MHLLYNDSDDSGLRCDVSSTCPGVHRFTLVHCWYCASCGAFFTRSILSPRTVDSAREECSSLTAWADCDKELAMAHTVQRLLRNSG